MTVSRTGRLLWPALIVLAFALVAPGPGAAAPLPEPGFAAPELADDACEEKTLVLFPECRRLRFSYGPLLVGPGNNAQMIGPVTIEKPAYEGYVTRIKPDLLRSSGSPPPVDVVHLHHGTWLSLPKYGASATGDIAPFFAAGEEKTTLEPIPGYGMRVRPTDVWLLNYMLHNATTDTETLWITYDMDYVPKEAAERHGIKPVVPVWLDVLSSSSHPLYPVFNVQKGFGEINPRTGVRECAYPRDRCAAFDPYGDDQPGNGLGWDFEIPAKVAGTIVGMGGHLHPGGLRDEVSVIRREGGRERARRIFNSEAVYYDPNGPVSWDLSMTVTPAEWRVRVKPGDKLRLNAIYETDRASWYEGMGIVMAFIAPGDASGVDPFQKVRVRAKGRRGKRGRGKARYRYRRIPIALRGPVTHGHLPENSNHGGRGVRPLPDLAGAETTDVTIAGFRYFPGDLSSVASEGIPRVKANRTLTFRNADAAAQVWHTITTCKAPCTGTTGISYPIADDASNIDSLELGYGSSALGAPTGNRHSFALRPREAGLEPGGTYTYFCRIHPFMRGAFKVVE